MIYFDQAATRLPRHPSVLAAVQRAASGQYGNPGRGGHDCAIRAGELIWEARSALATRLGTDPLRIVFACSGTDALNLLIHGLPNGSRVATTGIEHNSVLRPLLHRTQKGELACVTVATDKTGEILTEALPDMKNIDLLLVTGGSNVLGHRTDLAKLRAAVGHDVCVVIDGAQIVGEVPESDYVPFVDGVAAPGHKGLGGPPGTGFLWLKESLDLHPWRQGGTGTHSEQLAQPTDWPDGFEAGSQNLWGIAGLKAAVQRLPDPAQVAQMWQAWEVLAQLQSVAGVRIISETRRDKALPLISFVVDGVDAGELAWHLWEQHHIAVRAGLHCAPGAHRAAGTLAGGAVRASLAPGNTPAEAEQLVKAVRDFVL